MSLILPRRFETWERELAIKQARANAIAMGIAIAVGKAYPGHGFDITVQPEQGTVFIDYAAILEGTKVRYVVHNCDDIRKVLTMCGEILERAGLPRGELESLSQLDEAADTAQHAFATRN